MENMKQERIKSKKNYCTIYILRHGETEWNVKKIIQGHTDSALTKEGKKQAKQAAKRLRHIKFNAIFSSDLIRAKHTAEIVAIEHKLAVTTHKALRERNFGKFEGKHVSKLGEELKDLLDKLNKLGYQAKYSYKFPHGIETIESAVTRFITLLREIAVAYPKKTVLVVTHGGLMRHFLVHLGFATDKELSITLTGKVVKSSIGNTAHIKILCDGVDFFIKEAFRIKKRKI